jgi:hypothetical protein
MSEVLVVTELTEGKIGKPALELLTLARRLGDPVVVLLGEGADMAAETLGQYGASRVVSVVDPALNDYLVAPKAEAVAQDWARDVAHVVGRDAHDLDAAIQRMDHEPVVLELDPDHIGDLGGVPCDDEGLGERKSLDPRLELGGDQDAGGRFLEGPNHMHSFRPRFQVMKMN